MVIFLIKSCLLPLSWNTTCPERPPVSRRHIIQRSLYTGFTEYCTSVWLVVMVIMAPFLPYLYPAAQVPGRKYKNHIYPPCHETPPVERVHKLQWALYTGSIVVHGINSPICSLRVPGGRVPMYEPRPRLLYLRREAMRQGHGLWRWFWWRLLLGRMCLWVLPAARPHVQW